MLVIKRRKGEVDMESLAVIGSQGWMRLVIKVDLKVFAQRLFNAGDGYGLSEGRDWRVGDGSYFCASFNATRRKVAILLSVAFLKKEELAE